MAKTREMTIELGPVVVRGKVAVMPSRGAPGEDAVSAEEIQRFEREVARVVIENGINTPRALRLLRSVAGLSGTRLAELLGVTKETVSRWETGKGDVDDATWFVVSRLALDALEGRSDTIRLLNLRRVRDLEPKTTRDVNIEVPRDPVIDHLRRALALVLGSSRPRWPESSGAPFVYRRQLQAVWPQTGASESLDEALKRATIRMRAFEPQKEGTDVRYFLRKDL